MMNELIRKYNVAAPRYTSYPTVPYWDTVAPTTAQWAAEVQRTFAATNSSNGISLYIHLPFCESLCTYCGCNTRITVNHAVESPYITAVLNEWKLYLALFPAPPRIREIHLGGGTPTFFSAANLELLLQSICNSAEVCDDAEFSFEAHPANTTDAHLETLYRLGFRRLSLGIQDFDPKVQDIINRKQSVEDVRRVTTSARRIGYTSINYDLIYGLPLQTESGMQKTIEQVIALRPERIAFYSYAHVPWMKPGQRKFTEADLPEGETKRRLYENGRDAFLKAGYSENGMDHFSLPGDPLHKAEADKTLHRNFMGYTTTATRLLIGLGVSSISDAWTAFAQNEKKVEDYYARIAKGELPVFKGHLLTAEDEIIRKHILNIMCRMETSWADEAMQTAAVYEALPRLGELEKDGLVVVEPFRLTVKPEGKAFLRNIAMAFDARLWAKQPDTQVFSAAV